MIGASSQVRDDISIGKATAIQFSREGAHVVGVARSQDGLDSVVEACEAEGGQCDSVACDATDIEAVNVMIVMWGPIVYETIADNPELMAKFVRTQVIRRCV